MNPQKFSLAFKGKTTLKLLTLENFRVYGINNFVSLRPKTSCLTVLPLSDSVCERHTSVYIV